MAVQYLRIRTHVAKAEDWLLEVTITGLARIALVGNELAQANVKQAPVEA